MSSKYAALHEKHWHRHFEAGLVYEVLYGKGQQHKHQYQVNFKQMTQVNLGTKTTRQLRRVPPAVDASPVEREWCCHAISQEWCLAQFEGQYSQADIHDWFELLPVLQDEAGFIHV